MVLTEIAMNLLLALLGGVMIGTASLLLYAGSGRIAGISGILYGSVWERLTEQRWRLTFLLCLIGGGWLAHWGGVAALPTASFAPSSYILLTASGLLVGFGTRIGNGCTSGHGVCGLARRSPRSLASVLLFMAVGVLTATLLRPLLTGGH
jgi:uncharacterized membrane protein YedE/YeeE